MPNKTPLEKLRLRPGMAVSLRNVPDTLAATVRIPADARPVDDPAQADFILDFASTQAEAEERLTVLAPALREKTVMWLGYPKGSKAAGFDLNRDTIWQFARTVGLVLNANFSIDETWSAVRMRPAKPGE